jgi:CzcA family heavy metal efflux pump
MNKPRFRSGGLAAWSIRRPISVMMLAFTIVVLGAFSLDRLNIDLLPHIIYPEIGVRILEPGVPAKIMEDRITRQLEEQLAITEEAISVQSTTTEGRSAVELSFPYGSDINVALRDASNRLDRAKRFLPDTIDPPVIFKRDPSQIPVLELAVSSDKRSSVELRDWVDYQFTNWFLTLPGVASTEVGGGNIREIQIIVDQERMANLGLTFDDIRNALGEENLDASGGRLNVAERELSAKTSGRLRNVTEIASLPIWKKNNSDNTDQVIRIRDIARVIDTHEDERFRIRLNGTSAVKLSIQKQPQANTVEVVDAVKQQLNWMEQQNLVPDDIQVRQVNDQSVFVRHALNNASTAVISGAILAMLVVYVFLGDLRRTLIIGTAIPLAIFVTFIIMASGELTLNIMSLGGLALGVGMLVDNTIVMLENISRHQRMGEDADAPINAAREVTGAIVASTSTNLAAILPFLFIGGIYGLLFNELIYTLSAAILASLLVAMTVVPALAGRTPPVTQTRPGRLAQFMNRLMERIQHHYATQLDKLLKRPVLPIIIFTPLLIIAVLLLATHDSIQLPNIDEGQVSIRITSDPGTPIDDMDKTVRRLEALFSRQPEVQSIFTQSGGYTFGRSTYESSNRSRIDLQLVSATRRSLSSSEWIKKMDKEVKKLQLVGYKVRMRVKGIRGFRMSRGDDDISVRVQGDDLTRLGQIGNEIIDRLQDVKGLRNLEQNYEEVREELSITVNRERAADLGIQVSDISQALKVSLDGLIISDFIDGDRQYNIRLRLPRHDISSIDELDNVVVGNAGNQAIRLRDVATINLELSPATIKRDNQRRIVEVSASVESNYPLNRVLNDIYSRLDDLALPEGYILYDGGTRATLQEGRNISLVLIGLAIFLVFVVMAIQYESLRNPLVILVTIPFALIGVTIGLYVFQTKLSLPVWLGIIMLAGIVVNNAIMLVEQIEIQREKGNPLKQAITQAAMLRLRPILMTVLTTVVGMLPLALGIGQGSEMLQPLAMVIVSGLLFSTFVTLLLIPSVYALFYREQLRS